MGNEMYLMQPGLKIKKKLFFFHREMTSTCCRVEATVAWIEVTMRDCHSSAASESEQRACRVTNVSHYLSILCANVCVCMCACVWGSVCSSITSAMVSASTRLCAHQCSSHSGLCTLLHTRGWVSMLPSVTTSKGWEPRCCLFSFLSFFLLFFLLSVWQRF